MQSFKARGSVRAAAFSPRKPPGSTVYGTSLSNINTGNAYRLWRVAKPSALTGGLVKESTPRSAFNSSLFKGVHHVGLICSELERSLDFYVGILGLTINPDRPDSKLPYRGAWLMIGPEMIHLMELPNPDPLEGRPEHGGRDRHFCIAVEAGGVDAAKTALDEHGIAYTASKSGRPAIFFRDPDMNCLEVVELDDDWRA